MRTLSVKCLLTWRVTVGTLSVKIMSVDMEGDGGNPVCVMSVT